MERKKLLIILEIVLISILLVFCIVLEVRGNDFKRDCKETFDINGTCPCNSPKNNYFSTNLNNLNLSK